MTLAVLAAPPATFPPAGAPVAAPDLLAQSRVALFEGRITQAYRLLEEARPVLSKNDEWLKTSALVDLALERPFRAAAELSRIQRPDAVTAARLRSILRYQGADPLEVPFAPSGFRWPDLPGQLLRGVISLTPAPEGNLVLLTSSQVLLVNPQGRILAAQNLPGGRDLTLDPNGLPLALGEAAVFRANHTIPLPDAIQKPRSVAASPGGNLLVLDGREPAVFVLDAAGKVLGKKVLALPDPWKIRTDAVGRVYILDRRTRTVHVYGADLIPLTTIDPSKAGIDIRRADDLQVDFAGDVVILDGRRHQVSMFTLKGRLLGDSNRAAARMDAFGWNGRGSFYFLDGHDLYVGKVSL